MMTDRELLQQALDWFEQHKTPNPTIHANNLIASLSARLAQEEQEPAAWMFQHDDSGRMNCLSNDGMNTPENFLQANPRYELVCPLYTAPQPAAQPVPLTDEQAIELINTTKSGANGLAVAIVRAVEAAHGIGGEE